jgi:Flp pilus assembly protein TadB
VWLFCASVLFAAAAVIAKLGKGPPWLVYSCAIAAGVGATVLAWWRARAKRLDA